LLLKPGEKGVFGFEGLILATHISRAPLQIDFGEGLKGVLRGETSANVGDGDVHGEEDTAG
jgi:hypothetical protein